MKKFLFILAFSFLAITSAFAGHVNGYYKSNGTYVQGYERSNPNSTVRDNYDYKGNSNPYTGKEGNNYYRNNPTSEYYETEGSSTQEENQYNYGN